MAHLHGLKQQVTNPFLSGFRPPAIYLPSRMLEPIPIDSAHHTVRQIVEVNGSILSFTGGHGTLPQARVDCKQASQNSN